MARRLAAAVLLLVASLASASNTDWKALVDAYGRLNATQRPEFVKILVRKSPAHAERAVRNLVAAYPADKSSIASAASSAAPSQASAIRKVAGKTPSVMAHTSGMGGKPARHRGPMTTAQKVAALNKLGPNQVAPKHMQLTAAEVAAILAN